MTETLKEITVFITTCLVMYFLLRPTSAKKPKPKAKPQPQPKQKQQPVPKPKQTFKPAPVRPPQKKRTYRIPGRTTFADPRVWQLRILFESHFTGQIGSEISTKLGKKARHILSNAFHPAEDIAKTRTRILALIHPDSGDPGFTAAERQTLFQAFYPAIKLITKKEKIT